MHDQQGPLEGVVVLEVGVFMAAPFPTMQLAESSRARRRGVDQSYADPQLTERGFLCDAPHPQRGPVRQLGSPMRLSRTPSRRGPAGPALGSHTDAVLAGFGIEAPSAGTAR